MLKTILKMGAILLASALVSGAGVYLFLTLLIKGEETVAAPDLRNRDVIYALKLSTDMGLNIKFEGSEYSADYTPNHVMWQTPAPGTLIKKGRDVGIIISEGVKSCPVPEITGVNIYQAEIILEKEGLCLRKRTFAHSDEYARDHVMAQSPFPGTPVKVGECVDCLISRGGRPLRYMMPDFTDVPLEQALVFVKRRRLTIGRIETSWNRFKKTDAVLAQSPAAGCAVSREDGISLVVNRDSGRRTITGEALRRGPFLFTYEIGPSLINRHIEAMLDFSDGSAVFFDDYVGDARRLWILIPSDKKVGLELYEDEELVKSRFFE